MDAIAQLGDARTGSRLQQNHSEQSIHFQRHLRYALFPTSSPPKRAKIPVQADSMLLQGIMPGDLDGLKLAESSTAGGNCVKESLNANARPQTSAAFSRASPSTTREQAGPSPKRAKTHHHMLHSLSDLPPLPSCKGSCPKVGWSIEAFCSFCHG